MVTLSCRCFLSASGLSVSSRVFPILFSPLHSSGVPPPPVLLQSFSQFWGPLPPVLLKSSSQFWRLPPPVLLQFFSQFWGLPTPCTTTVLFTALGSPPLESFPGSHFDARFLFSSSDLRVLDPFELILYGVRERVI